jgi:outer membrane receptor for ferrienterochelin and colicins
VFTTTRSSGNKLKITGKYLLLAMAMSFTGIAFAQYEDSSVLNTIVVTGVSQPTLASQTVHNVKVINAKTIERQGAVNLKDLLSKELNVRIGNDVILGSSLSLQGISGQNVKILLDGVPLTGRENGNIDLGQINLNNIERIEIIEGPLSVIYGTDALGGVINLISKKITLDRPAMGFGNLYYETIRQYNFGFGGVVKLKDIDFGASINRNFFAGYSPDDNRVMLWKPKQQVFGNFSILKQTGKLKMRFKTDIFSEKIESRGNPVINHVEAYAYDEYYYTNRIINSLSLDYKINKTSYWNILSSFSYYTRDKLTYRKDLTTTDMEIVPNPAVNSNNSFLTVMSRGNYTNLLKDLHPLKKYFNYQIGYDVNFNSAFGTKIESDKGRMNDYAIFASAEIGIPSRKDSLKRNKASKVLSIKPGFRASYNTKYPAPFIPSIQVLYAGIKNLTFRYAYGRGFRAPALKELYLYFVDYNHNIKGNPDLKSELSDNHNIAIKYRLQINKKLVFYIDNSYYFNHIYNQIALVSINPLALEYTYSNIDNFKSKGVNLNISADYKALRISAGASYAGIYNNAFTQLDKKQYMYTPEFRTQVSYAMKNRRLSPTVFSVFHKYNGKIFGYALDETRNIVNTFTQGYHILDFTVNQPLMRKRFNLTFGCKNILNVSSIRSTSISNSFHSGGSNSMPISIGRSIFTQININI